MSIFILLIIICLFRGICYVRGICEFSGLAYLKFVSCNIFRDDRRTAWWTSMKKPRSFLSSFFYIKKLVSFSLFFVIEDIFIILFSLHWKIRLDYSVWFFFGSTKTSNRSCKKWYKIDRTGSSNNSRIVLFKVFV